MHTFKDKVTLNTSKVTVGGAVALLAELTIGFWEDRKSASIVLRLNNPKLSNPVVIL